jgi:hypothetical protein
MRPRLAFFFAIPLSLLAVPSAPGVASGATLTIPAGGDLQAALNNAAPGDTIVLAAGATYTGSFVLPAKSGSGVITVRTSTPDTLLPDGTRVGPASAPLLARIVSPDQTLAIATARAASNYRLVGLEVTVAPSVSFSYGLVGLGDTGANQDTLAEVPQNVSIERCWIHGNASASVRRGVALNSGSTTIRDCYLSDFHQVADDSQAICCWNGPGPFTIENNYLEAAAENVLFGGADPSIPYLVPSDITFRRNYCSKPISWKGGSPHWSVKNIFELKNAQRVLVDGNTFENCWADGQNGMAILLTPRNQDGTAPWTVVQDVTFTNNIVRNVAGGVNILGTDDRNSSLPTRRIAIRNNLFDNVSSAAYGGPGRWIQTINGPSDVTIDRNTCIQTDNITMADGASAPNFVFTGNIVLHNDYGVIGTGTGIGLPTLNRYYQGYVVSGNVIVGGDPSRYPAGNSFPTTLNAVGFEGPSSGDYDLAASSPFRGVAGADIDQIVAAQSGTQPPDGGGGDGGGGGGGGGSTPEQDGTRVSVSWTNMVGVQVANDSLWKSGSGWNYDAGASSAERVLGDGYLEFATPECGTERYVGLNDADTSTAIADIDYGFRFAALGNVEVWENGSRMAVVAQSYVPGDVFRVAIESGMVKYYVGGQLVYKSATSPASSQLVVDTTFYQQGGTIFHAVILQ